MGVTISREKGLSRTALSEDSVICLLLTGAAVADKIALSEPHQIYGSDALETLGITADNNPLAFKDISDFYANAGEGKELNIMLVSDATSLATMCDKANNIAKKLVDSVAGRAVILIVNKKAAAEYEVDLEDGFDSDVWTAADKLNELAKSYDDQNIPLVCVLPGFGFDSAHIADIPARNTLELDYVAMNLYCEKNDGLVSMGLLAAWLCKHQVHQNIGRTASGKVSNTAFFPNGASWLSLKNSVGTIAAKGLIIPAKVGSRAGYYFNDDPTLTSLDNDFSSISWNRVINKAKRIAFDVLVNKLNDDVDVNPSTGKIESTVASDWESDVENAIRAQMMKESPSQGTGKPKKVKEISGVKCTVDPDSDIINDEIDASIEIVRKGQAKNINVTIRYVETI